MDTWWIGEYLDYGRLLLFFLLSFLVSLYLIPLTVEGKTFTLTHLPRMAIRNKGLVVIASTLSLHFLGIIPSSAFILEHDVATIILLSIPVEIGADVAHIPNLFAGQGNEQKSKQHEGKQAGVSISQERSLNYLRLVRELAFEQEKAEIGLVRLEKKRYKGMCDIARDIRRSKRQS